MKYQIIFTASAEREIRKLPDDVQDKFLKKYRIWEIIQDHTATKDLLILKYLT